MTSKKRSAASRKPTKGGSAADDDGLMPITDYDLLALEKLIARYGRDALIERIQAYSDERVHELLAKAIAFREAVQRVIDEGGAK